MLGHFGFSYVGVLYLLMLFLPNIIWIKISRKNIPPKGKIVFWEYLKISGRCWQYVLRSFF